MMHSDPLQRPSSTSIFEHPLLCPPDSTTKSQLSHLLQLERNKNESLRRKLREARKLLKSYEMSKTPCKCCLLYLYIPYLFFVQYLYINLVLVGKRHHATDSPMQSDRKLRSYSRAKKRTSPDSLRNSRRSGFRDRNKNIVSLRIHSNI